MHYRNGREAKNGDIIIQLDSIGVPVKVGILKDAIPGKGYCNGIIVPIASDPMACLVDCLHVDDVAALLKERNLDKRPAGK